MQHLEVGEKLPSIAVKEPNCHLAQSEVAVWVRGPYHPSVTNSKLRSQVDVYHLIAGHFDIVDAAEGVLSMSSQDVLDASVVATNTSKPLA